ncbi:hypothetical protein GCM10027396_12660 [Insolitispirillum peregrinum]
MEWYEGEGSFLARENENSEEKINKIRKVVLYTHNAGCQRQSERTGGYGERIPSGVSGTQGEG